MSLITTLNSTVVVADSQTGSQALKRILSGSFTGSLFSYFTNFAVGTSPTSLTIPVTAAQFIYLKNTSTNALLNVTLTPLVLLAAPSTPTLSQVSGGSITATTYFAIITYVNQYGETVGSSEASFAVSSNNLLRITSPSASGSAPGTATGYNVYVSTTTGTETRQNGNTPIAIGANWTEPTSGLVAGTALPSFNTASGNPGTPVLMDVMPPGALRFFINIVAGCGWSAISLSSNGNGSGTCEYIISG